ncbi:hypothetical protein M2427_007305 [Bradyrhizobium sp. BR13661]|jgi:hypothetical protein|nr:hypothetical protein [Bradyrhizobium sp. BR13661]
MNSKIILSLAIAAAALSLPQGKSHARGYRAAVTVADIQGCVVVPTYNPFIYPTANWRPFFLRHYYQYGPVPICAVTSSISGPVIAAKF